MPNGYISKCSAPYWSNPPFLIFWHPGTLALIYMTYVMRLDCPLSILPTLPSHKTRRFTGHLYLLRQIVSNMLLGRMLGKATQDPRVTAQYDGRERLWTVERFNLKTDQDGDRTASDVRNRKQQKTTEERRPKCTESFVNGLDNSQRWFFLPHMEPLYMLWQIRLSLCLSVRNPPVLCQHEGTQRDVVITFG